MSGFPPNQPLHFTRRHFLIGAGAAAAGLTLYSGEISRHEIDLVPRTLTISNLPNAFHGFRIAQISDIHLDEFTEPFFLERIVHHVNALNADMVLFTGDFVTHGSLTFIAGRPAAHRCAEILSTVTCPLRYACLGNHDVSVSAPLVIDSLVANGIPVLVDQHVPIERNGSHFWLCAVNDPGTTNPRLELAVPPQPDAPVILMAHEPDYADTVLQHPRGRFVDVMLSGHTHGGQIRLPFFPPLVLPPMGKKYPEGFFQLGKMQLYVNRGIGTVGIPFRLNCPPEITIITLQSA
jgi:hypothetical protein